MFYSLCIETFHSYNNKNGVFPPFEFTSPFYVMAAPNNCPSVQEDFVTKNRLQFQDKELIFILKAN